MAEYISQGVVAAALQQYILSSKVRDFRSFTTRSPPPLPLPLSELPAALLHLLLRHGLLGRGGAGGAGAAQHGQQRGPHDGLPPQPNGNQRHQGAEPSPATPQNAVR